MLKDCESCLQLGEYEINFSSRPIDVLIAGAQKAGSTSLLHYLGQHEQIAGHSQIEFDYFVRDEQYGCGYDDIFAEYFPNGVHSGQVALGKAVAVMYIKEALKRLYYHNPSCKIILMLRDPVDRAYSAYWYARKLGWETASSFEEGLSLEEERLRQRGELARHCGYVDRGRYDEQIQMLYDYFGRNRVFPVIFGKFIRQPEMHCRLIFEFLEVNPYEVNVNRVYNKGGAVRYEWLAQMLTRVRRNPIARRIRSVVQNINPTLRVGRILDWVKEVNEQEFVPPPMNPETRHQLIDKFKPHVQRTMELTDLDLNHWLQVDKV